jgi:hypothetical protein
LCRCGPSAVVWSGNRDGPIWFWVPVPCDCVCSWRSGGASSAGRCCRRATGRRPTSRGPPASSGAPRTPRAVSHAAFPCSFCLPWGSTFNCLVDLVLFCLLFRPLL